MENRTYNKQILDAVVSFLEKDNPIFHVQEEAGFVETVYFIEHQINALPVKILVTENSIQIQTHYPVAADIRDQNAMDRLNLFLMQANHHTRTGIFYLDKENGFIWYSTDCFCAGLDAPSREMIEMGIYSTLSHCLDYASGILAVLFSNVPPAVAFGNCRKQMENDAFQHSDAEEDTVSIDTAVLNAVLDILNARKEEERLEEQQLCQSGDAFDLDDFIEEFFRQDDL